VTPLFFAGCSYGGAKIENEAFVFALARFLIGLSKQRGRVNCCENFWRKLRRQHFAALARNAERWPEDRLCGGRAETNQQRRFHQTQLRLEPWAAGGDFARVWFLVNSALSSRFPFKMLHGVRHVNMAAIDSRFLQSAVHDFARGSDKRLASDVFIIPRLFANQHNWRILGSLAKDSLRRVLVKMARRPFARSSANFA